MHWLQTLDTTLFHWVNPTLHNSVLDEVMPFVSGNRYFAPAAVIAAVLLAWRGGTRGRLCLLMIVLAVALGDTLVCGPLKQVVARQRPFWTLADAWIPPGIGKTDSGSMPSSHAANWFAAATVAYIYFRRSVRFMLPMAVLVGFSRVYNGVHYPGDVLAGAILGMGYAAGGVWTLDRWWRWVGRRWFPLWWARLPSLMEPGLDAKTASLNIPTTAESTAQAKSAQWMHLGYALILLHLAAGLILLASGTFDLSPDEAYQWTWSKHLALSYYSKPPLIAYTQFLGTALWGDTQFGVRFFSPVLAAMLSLCLMRFLRREAGARVAFWTLAATLTMPLLAVGSVLMTIDPLSVLFWMLAMISGWRANGENGSTSDWAWAGLWMALGFLSKYTQLFQLVSWVLFFVLWPPARKHLRRPGPYLALAHNLLGMLPVLIWNAQHGWITVEHVAQDGNLQKPWSPTPANLWHGLAYYTRDFLLAEAGLLNPVFFVLMAWAAFAFWRHTKQVQNAAVTQSAGPGFQRFLFSMGAPVFVCYALLSFRSRILPNWIAPSILPFLCLAAIYWEARWREGARWISRALAAGLILGGIIVVLLHDPLLISKVAGKPLPPEYDPFRRAHGWSETAAAVEEARQRLAAEGKPVFIVGGHYGITGELSFYLPDAKRCITTVPFVYYLAQQHPANQFFFWPNYLDRHGQNAIYAQEVDLQDEHAGGPDSLPGELARQFESVHCLGSIVVQANGQPVRRLALAECRNLR